MRCRLTAFIKLMDIFDILDSALKLVSALVGVALSLHGSIENSRKLYDVQKTKTTRQKSPLHLEKIQRKITEVRKVPLSKSIDHSCARVASDLSCARLSS